jgi:precorrin-8X/cobalt-precorrin-8 methylmutase
MQNVSLRQGDIIKNTYIDPGALTGEAYAISYKSRNIARKAIGDSSHEDRIKQRCSIAVGDLSMAGLMRFKNDPVKAGIKALRNGAEIYTDIKMVQAGILKKGHNSSISCALDHCGNLAIEKDITRTSAGFLNLGKKLENSIIVIGNAPSSLISVCGMIKSGIMPALVIGTPVGFVNASESKEELRSLDIPSISNEGTRGGTPVAVASINEIITIFIEENDDKGPCN